MHGDQAQIDKWFERITQDLTAQQKADLKNKFRREEELRATNLRRDSEFVIPAGMPESSHTDVKL